MPQKKVAVAGGSGLVGTHLVDQLVHEGAQVRASFYSRKPVQHEEHYQQDNLENLEDCLQLTEGCEQVYLCAVKSFGAEGMRDHPEAVILPNIQMHSNLLEACRRNQVKRVIFISSSTLYPEANYPIREDQLDLNVPPYEGYLAIGGVTRYQETLCHFYAKQFGLDSVIVRASNLYGPHDRFEGPGTHVLPALLKRALQKENPFEVWGSGAEIRDFLYIEDFVRDLLQIADSAPVCDPINIGFGQGIAIRDAAPVILDVCEHPVTPIFNAAKPSAIPYRVLSMQKYEHLFGQPKRTSLKAGLQKTLKFLGAP